MSLRMNGFGYFCRLLLGATLLLAGCAEAPEQAAAPSEPGPAPEAVEGQKAFYQMYVAARNWAADAQGLTLTSITIPEVESEAGKSGAWQATFVSPARRRLVTFNYSVVDLSGKFPKGVFQDHEEAYTGHGLNKPWPVSALSTSSEQAYEAVVERVETREYTKQNPDTPVMFLLELTNRHPVLTWRVVWGTSVSTSAYSVYVDASTGRPVEIMR